MGHMGEGVWSLGTLLEGAPKLAATPGAQCCCSESEGALPTRKASEGPWGA